MTGSTASFLGVPLKYVSLVTLTVQNSALAIVMHQSRVSTSASQRYFAPTAVLLCELLKCIFSVGVALRGIDKSMSEAEGGYVALETEEGRGEAPTASFPSAQAQDHDRHPRMRRLRKLYDEVLSPDCWKLSIPAVLYVLQNNLQFVAATNLDPTTFQVAYQLKILTTALFSVVLLRRRLGPDKWIALLVLTIGVGIVQIQTKEAQALLWGNSGDAGGALGSPSVLMSDKGGGVGDVPLSAGPIPLHAPPAPPTPFDSHRAYPPRVLDAPIMDPIKGFIAVITACLTSGLAGVYFEKVLKDSPADLWIRNVQLSSFSIIPALAPVLLLAARSGAAAPFAHFGAWASATVAMQVAGGLLTAIVIKHADNILKGFAVSFSIVLSFLVSILFFGYQVTWAFMLGATLTISSTVMYNRPERPAVAGSSAAMGSSSALASTAGGYQQVNQRESEEGTRGGNKWAQKNSMSMEDRRGAAGR